MRILDRSRTIHIMQDECTVGLLFCCDYQAICGGVFIKHSFEQVSDTLGVLLLWVLQGKVDGVLF